MGRFVAIGEASRVGAFALGGAAVLSAEGADEIRAAWARLPADAAVVVLTPEAAAVLGDDVHRHERALVAVMPP